MPAHGILEGMAIEWIAEVLGQAAELDPAIAAHAISPLVAWQDWRAVGAVKAHLSGSKPIGLRERLALNGYLAAAQQATEPRKTIE